MARKGGPSTLAGVDYQILYTASRFAEAITQDSITSLRPEAQLVESQLNASSQVSLNESAAPAVDDLTVAHHAAPTEYVSLKHQAGQAFWNAAQLISRGILDDFFQQHQQDPSAQLFLVSQSPAEPALRDCVDRAENLAPQQVASLEAGPLAVYQKLADYLRAHYMPTATSDAALLRFLSQITFITWSEEQLNEVMQLRLQAHTTDAPAAARVLYNYAMQAGKQQERVTPAAIRAELTRQGQPLILPPAHAEVLEQLEAVGSILAAVPATIGQQPGHHIPRSEVAGLVEWVLTPLPLVRSSEERAAQRSRIVTGGAGVGKTVVLRDLYQALRQQHVPVLALKADRIKGASKGALLADIRENGLHIPLQQALAVVATPERPAVILIDQLDALSMCLGAERGLLNSYTELLNDLQKLSHARFILSCRTFDLKHDPELAPFRAAEQLEIGQLTTEQVAEALQAASAGTIASLSPAVVRLLQTPLHLAIYCTLDPEARLGESATSLQGLYDKLLHEYLLSPRRLSAATGTKRVKDFLYSLAKAMNKHQQLTLPWLSWEEQDLDVCRYLSTQGVISNTGPRNQQLTFFHQTFYEYLFARQFVTNGQALADYVLASGQGLFLRSLTQQVLVFQRGNDFEAYLRDLCVLLASPACRFHLKLLLVQYLATQPAPEPAELDLVRAQVLTSPTLAHPFIEVVSHRPWLELLAEPTVFRHLSTGLTELPTGMGPSLSSTFLWVIAKHGPDLLLPKLFHLPAGPHRSSWISKALHDAGATAVAGFTDLFAQVFAGDKDHQQQFLFWQILANQAATRPAWVAQQLVAQLTDLLNNEVDTNQVEDYSKAQVIERLWQKDPHLTFSVCSRLLRTWVRRKHGYRNEDLAAYVWGKERYGLFPAPYALDRQNVGKRHDDPQSALTAVLHYCWKYLEDPAHLPQLGYQHLVAKWLHSRTDLLVSMALAAAAASPAAFTPTLLRLFLKKDWLGGAIHYEYIGYYTCQLLPEVWDNVTQSQRQQLADILASPGLVADVSVYTDHQEGKRKRENRSGIDALRYLQLLGPVRLQAFPILTRQLQEFTRRWGRPPAEKKPERPHVIHSGAPRSPSRKWTIAKISPASWLRALRKYRAKNQPEFWSDEGTYEGLCHHLNELIKENPAEWVSLVAYLINQQDESVAMLLPELCDADAAVASLLVELAYERQLLDKEAYRRLRRKVRPQAADPEQPVAEEFVQYDLATILANLTTESTIRISGKSTPQDILTHALNTPGARELYQLLQEKLPESQLDSLVEVLYQVAAHGSRPMRAAAVGHLAMLLRTSLPATALIDLFRELVGADYALLAAGQWSLQYLIWRDEAAVFALLAAGLAEPLAHETITRLLTVQWGHSTPGAFELLQEVWEVNPAMRAITMQQLRTGYEVWSNKTVLSEAINLFLSGSLDKELVSSLDSIFFELPPNSLPVMKALTRQYILVCAPHMEYDRGLLDYLARCVSQHPADCVELLALLHQETDKTTKGHLFKRSLLEIMIEAYTRLPHQNAQDAAVQAALDLFDELLKKPEVRNDDLKEVMREITSY